MQYWTSYYSLPSVNADDSLVLVLAYPAQRSAKLEYGEEAQVGVLEIDTQVFRPLATTTSWNWQQGSMQQWDNAAAGRILFNHHVSNKKYMGSASLDILSGHMVHYEYPVLSNSPDGNFVTSTDFGAIDAYYGGGRRYGFESNSGADMFEGGKVCLVITSRHRGENARVYRFDDLLAMLPKEERDEIVPKCIAPLAPYSPDGRLVCVGMLFLNGKTWRKGMELFVLGVTHDNVVRITGHNGSAASVSHWTWYGKETVMYWQNGQFWVRHLPYDKEREAIFPPLPDGHPSVNPSDSETVLCDTYPLGLPWDRKQCLWKGDLRTGTVEVIACHAVPAEFHHGYRCEFHPAWNASGRIICYNSAHEGLGRQVYVLRDD